MKAEITTNHKKGRQSLSEIKNIYVPTDFSEASEKAVPFAAEIARRTGAVLTLIHSIEEPIDLAPVSDEHKEKMIGRIKKSMDELTEDLKKKERYNDLQVKTTLLSGQPVTALQNRVEHGKPGLVVMATRGDSGTRNRLFGSQTTEAIRNLDVPVLAVPVERGFEGLENIVFATDYHEGDLEALENVVGLAELFGSKLTVLHVAEEQNLISEIKYRGFRDLVLEKLPHFSDNLRFGLEYAGDVHSGISGYLNDHRASVLVLIKHKKTFFETWTTKDHVKEMGFYAEIPLLVVPFTQEGPPS